VTRCLYVLYLCRNAEFMSPLWEHQW
jgi:hypothetical protein